MSVPFLWDITLESIEGDKQGKKKETNSIFKIFTYDNLNEFTQQIKNIIKTFKRSVKRKKLSAVGKHEFFNRKALIWQENYFKEIAEFNDEFGIDFDEDDEDDGDEDQFSSDTSIRLPGDDSQSNHDFETLTLNQSRFDRKSILRVHSGSSKFTARQRHKDSES